MADRTVAGQVTKYRARQGADRNIRRVEIQVPAIVAGDLRDSGARLRESFANAAAAPKRIGLVLGTVNAPRPVPIDGQRLVRCLLTDRPERRWLPHVEAFFDEVPVEAIHDLVLAGVVTFEDLYRAARTWRQLDGRSLPWIKEMADLRLARPPAWADDADGSPAPEPERQAPT